LVIEFVQKDILASSVKAERLKWIRTKGCRTVSFKFIEDLRNKEFQQKDICNHFQPISRILPATILSGKPALNKTRYRLK
jgi:hypothetical protein